VEAPEYTRIELKEINPSGERFLPFAISPVLSRGFSEERVLSQLRIFPGHVVLMCRDAPLLAEKIGTTTHLARLI
jgi:hypothetical protein